MTDWITGVYWPDRARKVPGTRVKHTMEMGNRYVVHFEKANRVHVEVTAYSFDSSHGIHKHANCRCVRTLAVRCLCD